MRTGNMLNGFINEDAAAAQGQVVNEGHHDGLGG